MSMSSRVPMTLRDQFWDDPFFKRSWDNFERLQQEMMRESAEMWKRFEEEMREMESRMTSSAIETSSSPFAKPSMTSSAVQTSSSSSAEHKEEMTEEKSEKSEHKSSTTSGKSLAKKRPNGFGEISSIPEPFSLTSRDSSLFFPRRWMLPQIFNEDFSKEMGLFQTQDDQVIRVKDDAGKFEVSLDTHAYRPDELKVGVENGLLMIDGKHEEKSDDGSRFVSRQFSRKYTLPAGCAAAAVNSNLSSDGVLMVTAPKAAVGANARAVPIASAEKRYSIA